MGVFREIFGPSKAEIWQQVANEIGGKFEDKGWFRTDILRFNSGQWEITLDTIHGGEDDPPSTRMRAPFVNKDDLRFKIYQEGIFTSISKLFGAQDIEVKDVFFDGKFMIKGNDEAKIKWLLEDEKLKSLISYQNNILFSVKDDGGWFGASYPDGVDELYFECYGVLKNVEDIKKLFELFTHTLERLVEIDSAYETNPRIKLL